MLSIYRFTAEESTAVERWGLTRPCYTLAEMRVHEKAQSIRKEINAFNIIVLSSEAVFFPFVFWLRSVRALWSQADHT